MTGGPEDHLLVGIAGVGRQVVVGADDGVDVDEVFWKGRLAGARMSHDRILPTWRWAVHLGREGATTFGRMEA